MSVSCPHCQKAVENAVPKDGYVPKDRLEAKSAKVDELTKALEEKGKLLEAAATRVKELEPIAAEHGRYKAEREADEALAGAGLKPPEGVEAAAWRRRVSLLHQDAVGDLDEGKRPTLADWLKDEKGGRADPILRGYYQAANAKPNTGAKPTGRPGQGQESTPRGAGAPKPPGQGADPSRGTVQGASAPAQMTIEQAMAYTKSPEFLALPMDQRQTLRAQFAAQFAPQG